MFEGNIGWLKIAEEDLWIHSTAPRNEHSKMDFGNMNSEKKFKFENRDFFPEQIWSCDRREGRLGPEPAK